MRARFHMIASMLVERLGEEGTMRKNVYPTVNQCRDEGVLI